jgi:6-phosphogluconate dehydrogenase
MGSMLSLLFAEHANIDVYIHDSWAESMKATVAKAKQAGLSHRVHARPSYHGLVSSFTSRKVILFSLPHGDTGDKVIATLSSYLRPGDIVIDGSNEDFLLTEKRQAVLQPLGVAHVGLGVSGGFSGARNGPSLMPSGDAWALDALMPLLSKIAAKDQLGQPCVTKVGPGGSGHYVKMVHNGIEHGVMSALCEAWGMMDRCLFMLGDKIADVFDSWNESGPLVSAPLPVYYLCINLLTAHPEQ